MIALPGYTLTELIHEGASTAIARGQRDSDGAGVIIKMLRGDFPTALDRARLRHEHALLSELSGRGIVPVRALESSGDHLALVMEDVGLSSLERRLGAGLDVGLVLRVALEVTAILRRAHERRIVHKDVKPHNILVGLDPLRVYLIDWGIAARLSEASRDGARPPQGEGTLAYISPEQTGMVDRPVGPPSDLYSLGVMLYQMLTGVLPFADHDPAALVQSHLTRAPIPPRDVAPRVPGQLSDIVMKLLAKSADDRYASARGLELDLAECLSQWERSGRVEPFPLGRRDRSGELRPPQRLIGREAEVAEVLSAFERVRRGAAELVLVTGYSGVGKSAVVREASAPMRLRGARLGAGKFEQLQGGAPYAPVIHALRALIRQAMTEREDALFELRSSILDALGRNAAVLTQLVPEVERLIGPQPPVPALGPIESENRFHLVMQRFVSVFTRADRPLVLFLDDLQWAEPASLKLLERLLTDPERGYLLVIGAHRDQDAERIELLTRAQGDIAAGGGTISRISLKPLTPADIGELVADTLRASPAEIAALSEEVYRKAHGNPFFAGQLLSSWVDDGLLTWDGEAEAWRWDLPAIAQRAVTGDAAAFVAQRLRRLDPAAQELLELAACLGAEFDHETLARIAGRSTPACARELWPALAEGLVVPLHDDYRLLADVEEGADAGAALAGAVTYRFLHDRVQEAAYSLLDEAERPRIHLGIARLLRARYAGEVPEDALFAVVDHLNAGRLLVEDRAERLAAAELCLRAGRRARASVAHAAARAYLGAGVAFLPEDAWESAYELTFALRKEQAEAVFLCGGAEEAAALFDDVLARAGSAARAADVHLARMGLQATAYRFQDAVQIGRAALATLGAPLPETEEACEAATSAEIEALRSRLRGRTLEGLLEAPRMSDPRASAILRFLLLLDVVSFPTGQPKLSALTSVRQAALSEGGGPSELSAVGYASCAQMLLRMSGRSEEADLMSRLSVALDERYPCPELRARLSLTQAHSVSLLRPANEAIAAYERAAEIALQHGDLSCWQIGTLLGLTFRIMVGDEELEAMRARCEAARTMLQRARSEQAILLAQLCLQTVACLQGRTKSPSSFDSDDFDEAAFLARAREKGMKLLISMRWCAKLLCLLLHGEHEAAAPLLEESAEMQRTFGQTLQGVCSFLLCLHLTALLPRSSGAEKERREAMLEEHHRALAARRALCDEAWRCQDLLITAERARLAGRELEAQRHYDEAVDAAQQGGSARLAALGGELYGRFAVERGLEKLARALLSEAHQGFVRWGAGVKADALMADLPRYLAPTIRHASSGTTSRGTATVALQGILFDLGEAMRAARSISSEIVEERIVEQILRASATYAPVQRALVVLLRDGEPKIAGRWTSGSNELRITTDAPLSSAELAESVVRFVARSQEPVVLTDAEPTDLFADDPYLRARRPRSLMCLPFTHQDRLLGMWYAESEVTRELRRGSVELMQLLAGHAASALENARLVAELEAAAADLSGVNHRLRAELEERARVERERAELSERIIAMQEEALLELQNPLIPISESITVLPIIGTIGERRASGMIEAVVRGAHARQVRVLIIDVTGLREASEQTARILLGMAGALRFLGTRVVLSGVRPDVARTLVSHGVEMKDIVVRSTLQAGIAYAMALPAHA